MADYHANAACLVPDRLTRRSLFVGAPLVAAPLAVPSLAKAEEPRETDWDRVIRVIEQLEAWQGWERSGIVAAKAFAARRMRKALGLDLPDPKLAQMHVDLQRQAFEEYRRTVWSERDVAEGRLYQIAPVERTLA